MAACLVGAGEGGAKLLGETCGGEDMLLTGQADPNDLAFLECLRWRTEREARRRLGEEFSRAPEKVEKKALEAAYDGDLQALRAYLDAGVWPECRNIYGDTLLSEASVGGQLEVVQFLLGIGANPNSHGRYRRTPLWRAAFTGHLEVGRALLRAGGDPGEPDDSVGFAFDVCPDAEFRALLACWHVHTEEAGVEKAVSKSPSSTRSRSKESADVEKERREEERRRRKHLQRTDLEEAISEAQRHSEIAQAEVARHSEYLQQLQSQMHEFESQAAAIENRAMRRSARALMEDEEIAVHSFSAAEKLLARSLALHQEAGRIAQELDWQVRRAHIKRKDWESAEAWRQQLAAGKLPGFHAEVCIETQQEWASLLAILSSDLELESEVISCDGMTLKPGDPLLCEGALLGQVRSKEELELVQVEAWPLSIWFNHGYDDVVRMSDLGKVLASPPGHGDVGLNGACFHEDGRWPLLVDPSGAVATFFKYSTLSAGTFFILQLRTGLNDVEVLLQFQRALLLAMLHGLVLVIDFADLGLSVEAAEEPIDTLEKGLFRKLTARGALFSYLLPRRFRSLITPQLAADFNLDGFTDEALSRFVLAFTTALREPDPEFARLFFTMSVKA